MTRKNKVLDFKTVQDEILSSTRKVWLAGLGVLATVEEEGQSLFAEFVEKGEKIEARGKKNWARTRKEIESTTEEVSGRLDELGSKVDENMPAAVATAMGARLSAPGPIPSAAGRTPKIMENAVIRTGRMRTGAAVRMASTLSIPCARSWLA